MSEPLSDERLAAIEYAVEHVESAFTQDVRDLLAEVERLRAAVERVRALCDERDDEARDSLSRMANGEPFLPGWTDEVRRALDGEPTP